MDRNGKRARVEQIKTLQSSWNDPPNLADDQEKFHLARKFVHEPQKHLKESLSKVGLPKRVWYTVKKKNGVVPRPKPVGRQPYLTEHEQAELKALVATKQHNMECIRAGNSGPGNFGAAVMNVKSGGHNNSSTVVSFPSARTMQKYQNTAADGGEKTGRNKNVKRVAWI